MLYYVFHRQLDALATLRGVLGGLDEFFNEKNFDFVMATAVLLVLAIPVGIANIYLGYVIGEGPCTLCWWERIGMVAVGVAGILILRYGLKARYMAAVFFGAAYGIL